MKLSATRLLPLAFVVLLALLSFWLERAAQMEEVHPAERRHDPDYVIDGLVIHAHDRDGRTVNALSASKMVHYSDDDSIDLEQPRVVERKPGGPAMSLRADRGAIRQSNDEIFLYDNVQLVREAAVDVPEARIESSFLHIVRSKSLVRSDREVTIREQGRMLAGHGMEYNNDTKELHLLSSVRGHFESRKRNTP